MAQTILITLTAGGSDTGPFDLYSDVDGYITPFENNVAKATLEAGYTSVVVPDGATIIRLHCDNSICDNFTDLVIVTTTTTTSSTSSTTTTSSTSSTTTSTSSTTTSTTTTAIPMGLIDILSNTSLDISISDVSVNTTPATVVSGSMPNTPGNSTLLETTIVGIGLDIDITYSASTTGQHITFVDSDGTVFCQNTNVGVNIMNLSGAVIDTITAATLEAADNTCI
jgi:hypothetical protein